MTARDPESGKRWQLKGALYEQGFNPERVDIPAPPPAGGGAPGDRGDGGERAAAVRQELESRRRRAESVEADTAVRQVAGRRRLPAGAVRPRATHPLVVRPRERTGRRAESRRLRRTCPATRSSRTPHCRGLATIVGRHHVSWGTPGPPTSMIAPPWSNRTPNAIGGPRSGAPWRPGSPDVVLRRGGRRRKRRQGATRAGWRGP